MPKLSQNVVVFIDHSVGCREWCITRDIHINIVVPQLRSVSTIEALVMLSCYFTFTIW